MKTHVRSISSILTSSNVLVRLEPNYSVNMYCAQNEMCQKTRTEICMKEIYEDIGNKHWGKHP